MRSVSKFIQQIVRDEDGGALIEYTVLLAILLVAVIAIIIAVGSWINEKWSALNNALS